MVAVEELLLYFVVVPAIAYAAGAAWLRLTMRKIAERQPGFLQEPGVNSKFLVATNVFAIPIVFGLVLLLQLISIPEGPPRDDVVRVLGQTYATAAVVTVLSEASIWVRWRASSFQSSFAKILVLIQMPETVILFVLVVGTLSAQALRTPAPEVRAGTLSKSILVVFFGGFLSAPLAAFLESAPDVLDEKGFVAALKGGAIAGSLAVACLALALFFLSSP